MIVRVQDRIKLIINEKCGGSLIQFSKKIGVNYNRINMIVIQGWKPSFKTLNHIKLAFPELNGDWLLTGLGEPWKK